MSDKMRWRYGDTNPVVAAVDSATVIEIGERGSPQLLSAARTDRIRSV